MNPSISPSPLPRRRGRPPRQGSGQSETREILLQAGVEILAEKGFSATGIDEILRRVGVPKGSFYHFFASKEAFGVALVRRYGELLSHKLERNLGNEALPPLERLRGFVAESRARMALHGFRRGCLVGNLGQETGCLPGSFRQLLARVFADWQGQVAACLEAARERGELAAGADCQRLAACFWIGWEGAVLRAKLEASPEPLDIFAEFFFAGLPR